MKTKNYSSGPEKFVYRERFYSRKQALQEAGSHSIMPFGLGRVVGRVMVKVAYRMCKTWYKLWYYGSDIEEERNRIKPRVRTRRGPRIKERPRKYRNSKNRRRVKL